jgi:hypothetical protein
VSAAEVELQPALADLQATPFRRFPHNFLRFSGLHGARLDALELFRHLA